jgi:hypothetical protein
MTEDNYSRSFQTIANNSNPVSSDFHFLIKNKKMGFPCNKLCEVTNGMVSCQSEYLATDRVYDGCGKIGGVASVQYGGGGVAYAPAAEVAYGAPVATYAPQGVAYGTAGVAYAPPATQVYAPQGIAYNPLPAVSYAQGPVVSYGGPQVAYGAPQVAYGAPQVAYGGPIGVAPAAQFGFADAGLSVSVGGGGLCGGTQCATAPGLKVGAQVTGTSYYASGGSAVIGACGDVETVVTGEDKCAGQSSNACCGNCFSLFSLYTNGFGPNQANDYMYARRGKCKTPKLFLNVFRIALVRAKKAPFAKHSKIDGDGWAQSVNNVEGRHIYLQKGCQYTFDYIGIESCDCVDESDENEDDYLFFSADSPVGGTGDSVASQLPESQKLYINRPVVWTVPQHIQGVVYLVSRIHAWATTVIIILPCGTFQ